MCASGRAFILESFYLCPSDFVVNVLSSDAASSIHFFFPRRAEVVVFLIHDSQQGPKDDYDFTR